MINSCSSIHNRDNGGIANMKTIKILVSFPTITYEGKFITIVDSFYIIYFKNRIIYRMPIQHINANQSFDKDGNQISQEVVSDIIYFKHFLYEKDSLYGLLFDSTSSATPKVCKVDSFINKKFSIRKELFFDDDDSLMEVSKGINEDLCEKYFKKKKVGHFGSDTSYLCFSKSLKNIDFSFHPRLDSIKQMKLVKATFISVPDSESAEPYFRYNRVVTLSMDTIGNFDTISVLRLIKSIKKH